jgi:elongation of very long chain fatty acids protein 7
MAHLLHDVYDWYRDLMDNRSGEWIQRTTFVAIFDNFNFFFALSNLADPRVKDWPMMQSPLPTLALCIFYAYFCKSLAPRLMENRKPFGLRKTLIFYNLFQTVFSAWIFYEVSRL